MHSDSRVSDGNIIDDVTALMIMLPTTDAGGHNGQYYRFRNGTGVPQLDHPGAVTSSSPVLWHSVVFGLLAAATSLVTVGGNLIVILSFIIERSIRQPSNYFIASLAVSDLLIGMCQCMYVYVSMYVRCIAACMGFNLFISAVTRCTTCRRRIDTTCHVMFRRKSSASVERVVLVDLLSFVNTFGSCSKVFRRINWQHCPRLSYEFVLGE